MGALAIAAFHSTNFPLTSLNLSQQKRQNTSSQMSAYMIRHDQLAEDNYHIHTTLVHTFFSKKMVYENCLCITMGYGTKTVCGEPVIIAVEHSAIAINKTVTRHVFLLDYDLKQLYWSITYGDTITSARFRATRQQIRQWV